MRGGLDRVGCARDWTFQVMSNSKLNPHPRNNYYFATPTTYYLPTETARVVCLAGCQRNGVYASSAY